MWIIYISIVILLGYYILQDRIIIYITKNKYKTLHKDERKLYKKVKCRICNKIILPKRYHKTNYEFLCKKWECRFEGYSEVI